MAKDVNEETHIEGSRGKNVYFLSLVGGGEKGRDFNVPTL